MRKPVYSALLAVSASALLAACGGGSEAVEEDVAANLAEPELTFNGANDLSAMDMAVNESVSEPLPVNMGDLAAEPGTEANTQPDEPAAPDEQVESNISGM